MPPDNTDDDAKKAAADAEAAKKAADAAQSPLVNKGAAPSLNLAGGGGPLAGAVTETDEAKEERLANAADAAKAAQIASSKEALKKRQQGEAAIDVAAATDDRETLERQNKMQRDFDIDVKSGKLKHGEFTPIPYKPTKPTSPVEQWGSMAMMFAMLGSLFTRNHAVTALNAAAAAMNGYKQGDEAASKQAFEEWKVANDNMLKAAEFQEKAYAQALKGLEDRKQYEREMNTARGKERTAQLKALATAFQDTTYLAEMEANAATGGYDGYIRHKKMLADGAEASVKATEAKEKMDANAAFRNMEKSGALDNPTLETINTVSALGSPLGSAWVKGKAAQIALQETRKRDAENTAEFQKAKEAGDHETMDALLAPFDPLAAKRASKRLEEESKKMTPEVTKQWIDDFKNLRADYQTLGAAQKRSPEMVKAYQQAEREFNAENKANGNTESMGEAFKQRKDALAAVKHAGKTADAVKTLDVVQQHLEIMLDAAEERKRISNSDIAGLNSWASRLGRALNNQDIVDYKAASLILPTELTKASTGGPIGTGAEREELRKLFDSGATEKTIKKTVDVLQKFVLGQAEGIYDTYGKYATPDELFAPRVARLIKPHIQAYPARPGTASEPNATSPGAAPGTAPKAFTIPSVGVYPAASVAQWVKDAKALPGRENMTDEQLVEEFRKQTSGGGK